MTTIAIVLFAVKHASAVVHLSSAINKFAQEYSANFFICAKTQNRQICVSSSSLRNMKIAHLRVQNNE